MILVWGQLVNVRSRPAVAWFGVPHPVISRWFDYWLKQDWRRMLSQRQRRILTLEVQQRVIESWPSFPGGQPGGCGSTCVPRGVGSPLTITGRIYSAYPPAGDRECAFSPDGLLEARSRVENTSNLREGEQLL